MTQSRTLSALEATTNVVLGWLVAMITQALVFPVIGLQVMLWQNLALSGVFTTMSFLRSYVMRRLFVRPNRWPCRVRNAAALPGASERCCPQGMAPSGLRLAFRGGSDGR